MPFLNTIKDSILNIVFPLRCLGCKKSGVYLCITCLSEIPAAERESEEWIFPIFDYRHPYTKKALWFLKYKKGRKFAEIFAEILYGKILEELSELSLMENFRDPVLIPIPLSKQRHRERGYNQAELIAKGLAFLDKGENFQLRTDILIKSKDTPHQTQIKNRSKRLENVIGTFMVQTGKEELIKNKNIILIDDILTTGATLTEAKKILRKSGARKVIAFTVAH